MEMKNKLMTSWYKNYTKRTGKNPSKFVIKRASNYYKKRKENSMWSWLIFR